MYSPIESSASIERAEDEKERSIVDVWASLSSTLVPRSGGVRRAISGRSKRAKAIEFSLLLAAWQFDSHWT